MRNLKIHSLLAENTQAGCWRIHSFYYRKSLEESENTQFLVGEYSSLMLENTQFLLYEIPYEEFDNTQFLVENTQFLL